MKVVINEKELAKFVNECVDFDRQYNSDRPNDKKFTEHSEMSMEDLLDEVHIDYEVVGTSKDYLPDYAIDALESYKAYLQEIADNPDEENELTLLTELLKYHK